MPITRGELVLDSSGKEALHSNEFLASTSQPGLMSAGDKKVIDALNSKSTNQAIPFIVGPDTDTTAGIWTGTYSGISKYTDGLTIIYVPNVKGASTTTLNINGLGAKTCYYNNTSKMTTHYAVGTPILLTYIEGKWKRADYNSDSNTYTSAYCDTAAATAAKAASCTNFALKDNSYVHVLIRYANTAASAITLNINKTGAKPIYINGLVSSASNYTLPAGTYIAYYDGTNYYINTDGTIYNIAPIEHTHVKADITDFDHTHDDRYYTETETNTLLDTKLDKLTYEYNKQLALGSSGKVCIGKFPMYDSNITVDINSTTNTTYHGTLVIATQNINTTGGGTYKAVVYGDANNTLTSRIKIKYVSGSNNFEVYIDLPGWSKNAIHIKAVALNGTPTNIIESVTEIPEDATIVPINALVTNFALLEHYHDDDYYTETEVNNLLKSYATQQWVIDKGYTTNTGTITGVSANGTSIATSGVANIPAATTSIYGVTKLLSSITSTSEVLAATPKAVKSAYDSARTTVTQTISTSDSNYRILLSATADDTTRTETARKSKNLLFNPSTGLLSTVSGIFSGGAHVNTATNTTPFIISRSGKTTEALKIGIDDSIAHFYYENDEKANKFLFTLYNSDSESAEGVSNTSTVTFTGGASGSTVIANNLQGKLNWSYLTNIPSTFTPASHTHPTSQINLLTGYSKGTSTEALATTDTLNAALAKLESKADLGVSAYNIVNSAYDGDGTIENLNEILQVLDGISDTDTIQAIIGKYLPLSGGSMNDGATIKLSTYGNRFLTISGNSIIADMSQTTGGWAGSFASVKDPADVTTTMLGWFGGTSGLNYIFMGGTYSSPAMKMTPEGIFTFKNALVADITGNAATATKATQDGSGNTITTTYLPLKGGTMSGDIKFGQNGIVVVPGNNDQYIWKVYSTTDGTYGFRLQYNGTGSGNDNSLSLVADNQSGTEVVAYSIKQDGSINFAKTPTVAGTAVSLSGHTHAYLPLSGGTMTGSITMGTNHYIYGVNESGGSMLHFDGTRTVIGSSGATTTASTHIRTKDAVLTVGTSTTASYVVLHSGNSSVTKSGQTLTVKINGVEQSITNSTYSSLKNPYSIKFKDVSGTTVTYDGSSAKDLTGGVYNATLATCVSSSGLNVETDITESGLRVYTGGGSGWTGTISSMAYAGILAFGTPSRGFQIWARRGSGSIGSLHFRVGIADASAWDEERIIIDSSTYSSYLPILNSSSTHATSSSVIYAPITAGSKGYLLTSSGSGAPSWTNPTNITVGNSDKLGGQSASYYASVSSLTDYVQKSNTGVQTIQGGLNIGGTPNAGTGRGRIMLTGNTNPLIGLQAIDSSGNLLTPYYFQVTSDKMYIGPTSSKALSFDSNGNVAMPATLKVTSTTTSSGFVKSGSSDSYVLLGGGGHKSLSSFLLESELATQELASNLTTISKSLTVTADWTDTGITGTDLPSNGTYIVQVSVAANNSTDSMWSCTWSGVMTWHKDSTNDTETDEILLHRAGHAYNNTIYLRTTMRSSSTLSLQIAANKTLSTAYTYTFKFKRII